MAKLEWTEVTDDQVLRRTSDFECLCTERDPDDHLLNVTEGTVSVTHGACGKEIPDDGYIEDWNTSEPIPVRVEFVNEGMDHYTGEHNGFWWEISPQGNDG